ncbi:hypothetical protein BDQ94DRAFT_15659 [Aspergillus welwitschiae]|uniref:Uncharacterized protein n=1 Tax=Aspergillus welwitschiae TaxID=1341132 RepID=A0A3F3Q7S6_9EURO|nr:hypothetical protein BDQ94DRAFT_15659 [Aspergillus welwitschiae]RDH34816.1 hypothetical protein BDQ94DRAFT_15659 [Aspergillus welwitschiae]
MFSYSAVLTSICCFCFPLEYSFLVRCPVLPISCHEMYISTLYASLCSLVLKREGFLFFNHTSTRTHILSKSQFLKLLFVHSCMGCSSYVKYTCTWLK